MVFVELLDRAFQRQRLPCLLQALHEVGGSGEQDAVAVFDQGMAKCGAEVRLAGAARAEQQDRVAAVDPSVAGDQRRDVGTTDHRHGGEVEVVERLAGRQVRREQVSLDASLGAFGELQLGKRGQ